MTYGRWKTEDLERWIKGAKSELQRKRTLLSHLPEHINALEADVVNMEKELQRRDTT